MILKCRQKGSIVHFYVTKYNIFVKGIYPLQYLTGVVYAIFSACCEKLTIFWLIFTNIQSKLNRFCSKNGWFLIIVAKFLPKILPKYKILVNQAQRTVFFALNLHLKVFTKLNDFSSTNTQISSSWGGTSPLRHPPPRARKRVTNSSPTNVEDGATPLV